MKSLHSKVALASCQFLALLTLQSLIGLPGAQTTTAAAPIMATLEVTSSNHEMVVTLSCEGVPEGSSASFHNRVGNVTRNVVVLGGEPDQGQYRIELNTTTEGYYYCQAADGNQTSEEVLLIAYPFSDSSIRRSYTAGLGESLRMYCTVPYGVVRERYSVRWFKGLTEILPDTEGFENFRFGEDGALEFSNVQISDTSRAYYCNVSVDRADGVVSRQGSTIELSVLAPLEMTRRLSDKPFEVNSAATFTCGASGLPVPRFRWLLNGVQFTTGVTSTNETRTSTVHVESTLTLASVSERDAGEVTCVAYSERSGGELLMVTSTANLVVLTNDFTVKLILRDSEVRISSMLPVTIPGPFALQVHFISSEAVSREESTYLWDQSLVNSREIDVAIPKGKLPTFLHFSVTVAIRHGTVNGPPTQASNALELTDELTDSCNCPEVAPPEDTGGSSTTVVAVVAVLVVVVLVGIVILVVGCVIIYYKKGVTVYKASSEYSRESLPRSVSRCSYGSERSHGSGRSSGSEHSSSSRHSGSSRSRSYSTHSVASSSKAEFVLEKVQEEPQDIRDYETIDHKMLKQWKQQQHSSHVDKQHPLRGSLEEIPQVKRVPEPVFPHTHIGVPNALAVPARHSHSSFEDLEEECLEFSTEVPKFRSC